MKYITGYRKCARLGWRKVKIPDLRKPGRKIDPERAVAEYIEPSREREARRCYWERIPLSRNSESGVNGVWWSESQQRWMSTVGRNGRLHRRMFRTMDEAVADNREARERLRLEAGPNGFRELIEWDYRRTLPKHVYYERTLGGRRRFVAEITDNGIRWRRRFSSRDEAELAAIDRCRQLGRIG